MPKRKIGRKNEEIKISDLHVSEKRFREMVDLPPLRPGRIRCLKCDQWFNSWDVIKNRRCGDCKSNEGYEEVFLEEIEDEELMDTALLDGEDD